MNNYTEQIKRKPAQEISGHLNLAWSVAEPAGKTQCMGEKMKTKSSGVPASSRFKEPAMTRTDYKQTYQLSRARMTDLHCSHSKVVVLLLAQLCVQKFSFLTDTVNYLFRRQFVQLRHFLSHDSGRLKTLRVQHNF